MPAETPYGSGMRRWRVTIEYLAGESTGGTIPIDDWDELAREWMGRRELRSDERFAANQTAAFAETEWQMAYRPDMDPDLVDVQKLRRLVYEGRQHDIVAASVIGMKRGIELLTLAGARTP